MRFEVRPVLKPIHSLELVGVHLYLNFYFVLLNDKFLQLVYDVPVIFLRVHNILPVLPSDKKALSVGLSPVDVLGPLQECHPVHADDPVLFIDDGELGL